tara:strand:- start:408 stop:695 length:288 start_codon:yes stop_codon:yes gene_type:complete
MAFKRWARAKSKNTPTRSWEEDEMKIIGWCLNKNIGVSIMPDWKHELNDWQIDIEINKKTFTDPNRYKDNDVLNKVVEYYKYYYNKYKLNTNQNG